jgi:four helix bundle protein
MVGVIKDFTDLEIYQLALDLANWIYEITATFPKEELYNLTSQMRRAVLSISTNIAEGYGRYTFKDRIHFCIYARGSLSETKSLVIFSQRRKYISEVQWLEYQRKHINLSVKLNNYISSLNKAGKTTV